jgi:MazG family protein
VPHDDLPPSGIDRLRSIMARLRSPGNGCPWDLEQTFDTIAPYTIEEAYEVADAIRRGDLADLKDELGDLLLQVVFHAQMAAERGAFTFDDVAAAISEKMIRRHPHVFADAALKPDAWEQLKEEERAGKAQGPSSALDGVALALPALSRALKLQKRAARVGFDWAEAKDILAKLTEELEELQAELTPALEGDKTALEAEFGDVLFVYVNLARHLGLDPEQALMRTNEKFERRFKEVEQRLLRKGKSTKEATLDEMESLWGDIKREEKEPS